MNRIRLFRVYLYRNNWSLQAITDPTVNHEHAICFADSEKKAAEIVQQVWSERGFNCHLFQVVELLLPTSAKAGVLEGFIAEPDNCGTEVELPGKDVPVDAGPLSRSDLNVSDLAGATEQAADVRFGPPRRR